MSEPVTRFAVGKREGGKRLDQFLHERIPGLSRTRIQRAIRERVTLSWGVRARASTPVRPGGEVHIGYTPIAEKPLAIRLRVIARGQGWLAVDKPPVIPVHPVNKIRENSLVRILRRQEGCESLRLVHRLDRETSGVLLVADNHETARELSMAFMQGRVHKEYLARVRGEVVGESGRIDLPLGDDDDSEIFVRRRAGTGQPAETRWQVERRLEGATLLRLFPRTGRRHQLRVHLEAIGHPIEGDILYGRDDEAYLKLVRGEGDVRHGEDGPTRQLLHCTRLTFPDPAGHGELVVEVAPPADFALAGRVD